MKPTNSKELGTSTNSKSNKTTFRKVTKSDDPKNKISYLQGNLKTIKLSLLKVHPLNKGIYEENKELIKSLAENIQRNSLINRITINNQNQILSGNLRFKALQILNVNETEVYVADINLKDELEFIISSNQQREKTIIDMRNEIEALFEKYSPGQGNRDSEGENTINKISSITGYKTSKISIIRRINNVYPELLKEIDKGNLTLNGALMQCKRVIAIKEIEKETKKDLTSNLNINNIEKKFNDSLLSYCNDNYPEYSEMLKKGEITPEKTYNEIFCEPKVDRTTEKEPSSNKLITPLLCPCCSQIIKNNKEVNWLIKNKNRIEDFIIKIKK